MIVGSAGKVAGKVAAYFDCMSEFLALWQPIHSSSYHGYDRSKVRLRKLKLLVANPKILKQAPVDLG